MKVLLVIICMIFIFAHPAYTLEDAVKKQAQFFSTAYEQELKPKSSCVREISRPQLRLKELYRHDMRQDNHELLITRLSIIFNYLDKNENPLFQFTPFFEIRRNTEKDLFERKEAGIEIGKDIFSWCYLGQAIQKGWMEEDYRYRLCYEVRDYLDSETRLYLTHDLVKSKFLKLKGFVLDEYTYDFDVRGGRSNELVFGLTIPFGRYIETEVDWRHIDRIHNYDSDTIEASLTLIF